VNHIFKTIRNIKSGTTNLIKYFPIIWNDRQWDYYYIYVILHKKLELMDKFFNSDKSYTSKSEGITEQIQEVKLLCEKLMNDNYLEEALKPFEEKYGEVALFKIVGNKLEHNVDDETLSTYREYGRSSDENAENDKNKLFDLLKQNINNFWD